MNLSKKLRVMFTRALLDSYPLDKSFSPKDRDCFLWLTGLQGDDVKKIVNPEWPDSSRHVAIDGKATSWNRAINEPDEHQLVLAVMREAIRPDLLDFKSCTDGICEICGSDKDITVDHVDPPFIKIAESFLNENDVVITEKENGVGRMFQDVDLESTWIVYHASRAIYQILCRSCNSKKGATGGPRHDRA